MGWIPPLVGPRAVPSCKTEQMTKPQRRRTVGARARLCPIIGILLVRRAPRRWCYRPRTARRLHAVPGFWSLTRTTGCERIGSSPRAQLAHHRVRVPVHSHSCAVLGRPGYGPEDGSAPRTRTARSWRRKRHRSRTICQRLRRTPVAGPNPGCFPGRLREELAFSSSCLTAQRKRRSLARLAVRPKVASARGRYW